MWSDFSHLHNKYQGDIRIPSKDMNTWKWRKIIINIAVGDSDAGLRVSGASA